MQAADTVLERFRRADGEGWIVADGIPPVAEGGSTAYGRSAFTTDPEGRMRLLNRLGEKPDVGETHVLAFECRIIGSPKLLEGADVLVGHGSTLVEGLAAHGFKLLATPTDADADDEPAARQHVESRQSLGRHQRVAMGHDEHRGRQPNGAGAPGHVCQRRDLLHGLT